MQIAVLGMGRMGRALAGRLLGGRHSVVVWNRSKGKADEVLSAGGREAGSIADAVEGAEVVITSLSDDDAVRAVALRAGGIRSTLGPDAVYADASTVSPFLGEELAAEFGRFVSMPILGAPAAVESGQASYLIGGAPATAERLEPLLATLSDTVRRYDTPAKAIDAKLASNLLLLTELAALAEAFAVARAGGLTDDELRDLFGTSPMLPPGLENRFEGLLTGRMDPWFAPSLGAKDAGLAVAAATATGITLPLTETARQLYRDTAVTAGDDTDIVAISRRYRRS
jgi:3-hydroxyisobutyrate dehydrogenase-like beta-hydroxyacid dehydrogenase